MIIDATNGGSCVVKREPTKIQRMNAGKIEKSTSTETARVKSRTRPYLHWRIGASPGEE
jgi:hypothetical protein